MKLNTIMTAKMMLATGAFLAAMAVSSAAISAECKKPTVRLSGKEVSIVPQLTQALGNFEREGLNVVLVDKAIIQPENYLMQAALHKGVVDASVHWFQHVIYGAGNEVPVKAVMVINDAPGATVMVANRVKGEIRSGADFKGRNIAEGMGYATKSILTNYLATREGVPLHSYTPVMKEVDGRRESVIKGLEEGAVDVMTFLEPMTTSLKETGKVTALYDLTDRAHTKEVLGDAWVAQTLFLTPEYIKKNPKVVQKLVNSFVRTMRFINSSSPEQIAQKLPDSYFEGKNRQQEIAKIKGNYGTFAKDVYSFTSEEAKLVIDSTQAAPFDETEEGKFRARSKLVKIDPRDTYTNEFVDAAMKSIR